MKQFLNWTEKFINVLIFLLFVCMTVMVFTQVILRYGFDSNIFWAEEFSRYSMIWIAFLGAAVGIKHNEHTRIDFFVKLLPRKVSKMIEILNRLLCIFFVAFITYSSITLLENLMNLKTPSLQIPVGLVHLALPVAGVIMIAYLIVQIILLVKNVEEEETLTKGDHLA